MSEKSEEKIVVYRTLDWQEQIATIAGPRQPSDTKESWLARAARKSGTAFWHIKALYYGQLTDPKYSVAYKILSAADKARIAEAQRDATVVANFFNSHAQALSNIDPEFHRPAIDAFVEAARIISGRNST
jgi:hypothetical protein